MKVSDFQVGQIVEYNGHGNTKAKKGAKAIVIKNTDYQYLNVQWIKDSFSGGQGDGGYYPENFTIITMAPKKKLQFLHKNRLISNLEYLEALNEK